MEAVKLFAIKYAVYAHLYSVSSTAFAGQCLFLHSLTLLKISRIVTADAPSINKFKDLPTKAADLPVKRSVKQVNLQHLFSKGNLCKELLNYSNITLYLLLSDLEEASGCRVCINISLHKQLYLVQDSFYIFSFLYRVYLNFCKGLHINLAVFLKFLLIAVESEDIELLILAINGLFPFYSFAKFPAIMTMLQNIISIFWPYFCEKYGVVGFRCSLTGKIGRRLLTRANTLRFSFGVTAGGTASTRLIFKQHQVQSRTGAFGLVVGVYYR